MYFKLFYIYVKTNGFYPDADNINYANLFRVALNHVENKVKEIYNKTAPDSWNELPLFNEDKLLRSMGSYLEAWYDLDEVFVSAFWALCEKEFDDIDGLTELKERAEANDKIVELVPRIAEFIPYSDVREAIGSMRQMTDNGFFNILGTYTYKADTMREQMLEDMETVIHFIDRYRRS